MKIFASFVIFALTVTGNQATACAFCLDIFPEVIVLDRESTKILLSQNPKLRSGVTISEISCSKQNYINGNGSEPTCTIKSEKDLSLSGAEAFSLYNRLGTLTVEIDASVDDNWKRTGERTGPIAFTSETERSTVRSIPMIHAGKVTCPLLEGGVRCEIELSVLSAVLVGK